MRRGVVVERGPTPRLVTAPDHEYTRRLIAAARATALDAGGAVTVDARGHAGRGRARGARR